MISLPQRARRATKEKIKPLAINMFHDSYIHGFKEMYESSNMVRAFWITVFGLCLSALAYEVYQVFKLWLEEGVATKISMETVPEMKYPTVLFCPTSWLNKTRLDEFNIDGRALKYLISLLALVSNRMPGGWYWPNDNDKKLLADVLASTGSATVGDFMKEISMSPAAITCSCCDESTIDRIVTKFGVCYVIDLCETPFQTHSVPSIVFAIDKKHILRDEDDSENDYRSGFVTLFDNRQSIAFSTHDTIFLSPGVPVLIRLSLTLVKRISTRKKPCADTPFSSVFACELECYDRIENRNCRNCSMFSIVRERSEWEPCGKEHEILDCVGARDQQAKMDFLNCKKSCVPPCTERIFSTSTASAMTTLTYKEKGNATSEEVLQAMFLFTSFTETLFEDVEIFNFDTFISSLGGQAGLWCGASIISLFHLFSYCCCPCLHSIKAKSKARKLTKDKLRHPEEDYATAGEDEVQIELNPRILEKEPMDGEKL